MSFGNLIEINRKGSFKTRARIGFYHFVKELAFSFRESLKSQISRRTRNQKRSIHRVCEAFDFDVHRREVGF